MVRPSRRWTSHRKRDTELTTGLNRDAADLDAPNSDVEGDGVDTPASIDWESEDNPYKKRFSGEQSRSARLESELETASSTGASLTSLVNRFDTLEDMVAEISDRGDARASDQLDSFDDGLDDEPQRAATGKAREKIQESRQAQSVRENNAQAQKVYDRLSQGWTAGMDAKSPEMVEVTRLYNEALADPALGGQLNTALTLFDSYKRSVASEAAKLPPPPTPKSEGDGDGNDAADDSSESDDDILEADDDEGKLTARQRNAASNAGQGQEGSGSSVPRDISTLTPEQKFGLHHEGKTPKTY
jgi:hypothetical protein